MDDIKDDLTLLSRFSSKIKKERCLNIESLKHYSNLIFDEECWIWIAYIDRDGYGTIGIGPIGKKKVKLAHRVSYELFIGEIPKNCLVCHYCDTPSCVNPNHLFIGTHKSNNNDRKIKNRSAFGERNGMYTKPETRVFGNESNAKNWKIISENNDVFLVTNLTKFCKDNNLIYDKLLYFSRVDKFYKKFKCEKR